MKKPPQLTTPLTRIHASKEPRRPHYLAKWMARYDVDRAQLIEDLNADKGQLSRWLDEEKPTTPGRKWAEKLGFYFQEIGHEDEMVDIFKDPDEERLRRVFVGRSRDEIERILNMVETGFPPAQQSKK
jgi:hypothetical protein